MDESCQFFKIGCSIYSDSFPLCALTKESHGSQDRMEKKKPPYLLQMYYLIKIMILVSSEEKEFGS